MHNSCHDNKHATAMQLLDKCTLPLISCHDNIYTVAMTSSHNFVTQNCIVFTILICVSQLWHES